MADSKIIQHTLIRTFLKWLCLILFLGMAIASCTTYMALNENKDGDLCHYVRKSDRAAIANDEAWVVQGVPCLPSYQDIVLFFGNALFVAFVFLTPIGILFLVVAKR